MALEKFTGGIAVVILFAIAMILFLTSFLGANNPSALAFNGNPFINDSLNSLQARATELQTLGDDTKDILASDQPSAVYIFLILKAAFTIPLAFLFFLINGASTVLVIVWSSIFGVGSSPYSIVFGIVSALFIVGAVMLILREIRLGRG